MSPRGTHAKAPQCHSVLVVNSQPSEQHNGLAGSVQRKRLSEVSCFRELDVVLAFTTVSTRTASSKGVAAVSTQARGRWWQGQGVDGRGRRLVARAGAGRWWQGQGVGGKGRALVAGAGG